MYAEFDPFLTNPEPSNPWISDNLEFWEQEVSMWVNQDGLAFANIVLNPSSDLPHSAGFPQGLEKRKNKITLDFHYEGSQSIP